MFKANSYSSYKCIIKVIVTMWNTLKRKFSKVVPNLFVIFEQEVATLEPTRKQTHLNGEHVFYLT